MKKVRTKIFYIGVFALALQLLLSLARVGKHSIQALDNFQYPGSDESNSSSAHIEEFLNYGE